MSRMKKIENLSIVNPFYTYVICEIKLFLVDGLFAVVVFLLQRFRLRGFYPDGLTTFDAICVHRVDRA